MFSNDMSIAEAEEYILEEINSINREDSVVLNMALIGTVSVRIIPLLIIISYLAYEKSHKFVRLINVSSELRNRLVQIGFWNLRYISHVGHLDRLSDSGIGKEHIVLPITCVEDDRHLNDMFKNIRQNRSIAFSSELKTTLGEILNLLGENCLDHSGLEKGVGFYAFIIESDGKCVLTVLDMGMGFYNSLSRRYPNIKSDAEAISRVLEENISRRERGGCGYFQIKNLIDTFSGSIMIRSGDAIIYYGNGEIKSKIETVEKITGCCVLVELKCD